jgi:acetylornithine deacetylase/succinyl-diaminopimelate desuccinylase-like protein
MDSTLVERVSELAVAIQQIGAPTFEEVQRAKFVRARFRKEGLKDVSIDEVGNVYACLPGKGVAPSLIVSAHLDTVFPASTALDVVRREDWISGPGIGDNSVGVASLFGLLWALREERVVLPGDLWLVGNVGEEGLGDLRGMRAVVARFGDQPLAYIILEGMALGQIYHRGLAVRRYRITARTGGGHSWVDFGKPSAVHELARLVTRLADLTLPAQPRTTLNVGVIAGGTTVNTIAAEAHLELDLRSETVEGLEGLVTELKALVRKANSPEVRFKVEVIGDRPAGEISPEHPLVRLAARSLVSIGLRPNASIGSTDANIPLSLGLPAVCIGLALGEGAHTQGEQIYTPSLAQGLRQLLMIVRGAYRNLWQAPK